jgi:4-hydroxy-tetrahydrodipicolinate reductase
MTTNVTQPRIRIAVHGAAGRMGRRLVALAGADADCQIVAALESEEHDDLGKDAGMVAGIDVIGVPLSSSIDVDADVVIDFSVPDSAVVLCRECVHRRIPLVLATTGFSASQQEEIERAAQKIPLVSSPNMSRAVNLTMKLATLAARVLKDDPQGADVEIIERHHRFKHDAPSGTALRFGELISQVMGQTRHQHGRHGITGRRPRDEIGYHAVRTGDNPGEHTIVFGLLGETIELVVRATNRDCYALGALVAAKFVVGKPPGRYGMYDVLGLCAD